MKPLDIIQVWQLLGGGDLRGKRGRAFWREGDGYNVSLDKAEGVFYDHRDRHGGGVLELVEVVLRFDRVGAIDWFAMSHAAAAPLSPPFSEQSGSFHFHGPTSVGKTTTPTGAGSLWGGGFQNGSSRFWLTIANAVVTRAANTAMSADFGKAISDHPIRLSQYHSSAGERSFRRHIYIDLLEKFKEKSSKAGLSGSVLESTNVQGRRIGLDFAESQT